ncbi:MAG: hypothetical protein K2Y05_11470 [Hyphomicrobiaceae bacterium]|nr:hypothetical protein [Hyphomicrobiaceae bacterium]
MPGGDGAVSEPLAGGDARGGLTWAAAGVGTRAVTASSSEADAVAAAANAVLRGC